MKIFLASRMPCLALALALVLICNASGQATLLGDFSIKDEAKLGEKFHVLMHSRFPLVQDPEILGFVRELSEEIKDILPPQPFPIKLNVVLDSSINAFAAPAGQIYVNTGLILRMREAEDLAAVIAHEMAHVSQRHIAHNIEKSKLISIGTLAGVLAGALLGQTGAAAGAEALAIGAMAGGQAAMLKFSRNNEREADQIGLQFLCSAGFPAEGMLHSFETIKRSSMLSGNSAPPAYMTTHPGLPERIGYIKDLAKRMNLDKGKKEQARDWNIHLARAKLLIRAKYSDPETAIQYFKNQEELSCLDKLGKAIALERVNQILEARKMLEKAMQCNGEDSLWLREQGIFYYKQGKFDKAMSSLNRALDKDKQEYMALFYWAKIKSEHGEAEQAAQALRRILDYAPQDSEVHYVLGRVLGQGGDPFQGYLHFAYSFMYKNNGERSRYYYKKAKRIAESREQKGMLSKYRKVYEKRKEYW